jgi:hypothetical protein
MASSSWSKTKSTPFDVAEAKADEAFAEWAAGLGPESGGRIDPQLATSSYRWPEEA